MANVQSLPPIFDAEEEKYRLIGTAAIRVLAGVIEKAIESMKQNHSTLYHFTEEDQEWFNLAIDALDQNPQAVTETVLDSLADILPFFGIPVVRR